MEKKEYKVGNEFWFNGVKLRCEKSNILCEGCYFIENEDVNCYEDKEYSKIGSCIRTNRKDKQDVIFVEVKE